MFFYASKLLWLILQPSNLLLLLLAAALLGLGLGGRRFAGRLLVAATTVLVAGGLLPVGEWLLLPLENRFPAPPELPARIDGVIVLGGATNVPVVEGRGGVELEAPADRLTALIELGRRYPDARLVFTGGSARIVGDATSEAEVARLFYQRQGFDAARILFEDASRDTFENAVLSRRLVDPAPDQRWLLVTSASHMPRAVGVFRAAGWPVVAYPVDFRTTGRWRLWAGLDVAQRLKELDEAVKAWIGLAAYRLSGRTDALLPAP